MSDNGPLDPDLPPEAALPPPEDGESGEGLEGKIAERNRRGGRTVLVLVVAALVLIGAGALVWRYRQALPEETPAAGTESGDPVAALGDRVRAVESALDGLDRKVEALDSRVGDLKDGLPDNAASADDVAALRQRLGALEQGLADLNEKGGGGAGGDSPAVAAKLAALEQSVATLQLGASHAVDPQAFAKTQADLAALQDAQAKTLADLKAQADRMAASARDLSAVYGLARLRSVVAAGAPYADRLASLRQEIEALPEGAQQAAPLDRLAGGARQGVPTLPVLAQSFETAAQAALRAEKMAGREDFFDRLVGEASTLVTVRPAGAVAGEDTGARIARAEDDLDKGLLADAVREIESLNPAPKAAFAGWLGQAGARLEALAALDALDAAIGSRLSRAGTE